ncbi:unnamed protein product [Brassicogethes aeneus]|uniref:Reverse transcriptase domain-containing protein n=1 Tax=Brassicogethes aeneus TaxID=1431903 RepID=A0A9P0B822_BRAAE|nr:unnamed protein product [Brassicogethes aeneus]
MLKNMAPEGFFFLLKFFNDLLSGREAVPTSWSEIVIFPLLKPDKDPNLYNSYRPIALTSCIKKVFEHLIKNRFQWWIKNKDLLPDNQFGFRGGRSTIDCVSIFVSAIQTGFMQRSATRALFLDIESAYDRVLPDILYNDLIEMGIPQFLASLIFNLTQEKHFIMRHSGVEISRLSRLGLPQGSVLSPVLFNVYVRKIEDALPIGVRFLQYANDIVLFSTHKDQNLLEYRLSRAIESVYSWLSERGLSLNPGKCRDMIFAKRIPLFNSISLQGAPIPSVNTNKFLGIILDSKLLWNAHVPDMSSKCTKYLNILKSLTGVRWGGDPKTLLYIYRALIRSRIDYGLILINYFTLKNESRFNKIQFQALRVCLGAMRSSPTNALQIEACEPPLRFRKHFLTDKFLLKNFSISNNPVIYHIEILRTSIYARGASAEKNDLVLAMNNLADVRCRISVKNKLPIYSSDYFKCKIKIPHCFDLGIPRDPRLKTFNNSIFKEVTKKKWPDFTHIFTDGSVVPSVSTSYGVYSENLQINFSCNIQ